MSDLSSFFEPKTVAVAGSLGKLAFGGQVVRNNLLNFGYSGRVYLVNPSYDEVQGSKVYPTIKDIPETPDLAVVITPARTVPSIINDCVDKGVKSVIIGADGFAERGEEGAKLQREIVSIAKRGQIHLVGPNTIGTVNSMNGLVTATYPMDYTKIRRGNIALIAQTGLIGPQAFPYGEWGVGVSKICDLGNKCDVNESDLLEYLVEDPQTKVIAMHLEDIKEGQRFLEIAKMVTLHKPVLILKPGRTKESKKALISHTGSLLGNQKVCEAAFRQAGVISLSTFDEIFDVAKAFSCQPLPRGNRLGVITYTGGGGIMAIDAAAESGLTLAQFSSSTEEELSKIYPALKKGNPSDMGPLFTQDIFPYKEITEIILNDRNVDCVLGVIYTGQLLSPEFYLPILNEVKKPEGKPVVFWIYGTNREMMDQACFKLEQNGYPVYQHIGAAIRALGAMYQYKERNLKEE